MQHLPYLIKDLAIILVAASIMGLVFRWLRQPSVIGYILAGFLVSPHTPFLPTITDTANVQVWAELGVIFLLFTLGLEFSFRKFLKRGWTAPLTALIETSSMVAIGYLTGRAMGFNDINSWFLGGILSISSTTIIIRTFRELGLRGQKFVDLVFGILVAEDLVAVVLLVILSALGAAKGLSGINLSMTILQLGFFLCLWLLIGLFFVPFILKKLFRHFDEEFLLITSLGLCLLMVLITTEAGFSAALGAFLMGSILAETPQVHRIERVLDSVRDLFSAVFFVSVGLLINPWVMIDQWPLILFFSMVLIVGKFSTTLIGALLAGERPRVAIQAGLSLTQIGEFSFIIAGLGATLKVTDERLSALAVSVSIITTFFTPFLLKRSGAIAQFIKLRSPQRLTFLLEDYRRSVSSRGQGSAATLLLRTHGYHVTFNSVLIAGFALLVRKFGPRLFEPFFESGRMLQYFLALIALILTSPFFFGVLLGRSQPDNLSSAEKERLKDLDIGVKIVRWSLAVALLAVLLSQFVSFRATSIAVVVLFGLIAVLLFRPSRFFYRKFERIFYDNLSFSRSATRNGEDSDRNLNHLAPWDLELSEIAISPLSNVAGKTLAASHLKENYNLIVAAIGRGERTLLAPSADEILYPGDELFCLGKEDDLLRATEYISAEKHSEDSAGSDFGLFPFTITAKSPLAYQRIKDCGLRDQARGLIVGLERMQQRYLNPDPESTLQPGDLVWIVGPLRELRKLLPEL